jgi:hypothetical protein
MKSGCSLKENISLNTIHHEDMVAPVSRRELRGLDDNVYLLVSKGLDKPHIGPTTATLTYWSCC